MKNKKRPIILACTILIIVALIILTWRFANRKYYIAGVLIMLLAIIPFFFAFEGRKPQARDMAVLAVIIAIAVVSRVIFIWLPGFKPMTGIIIISGTIFGGEAGFLIGAISAFVSNFVFGQGPWTTWQMFAFGVAGLVPGLLKRGRILPDDKLIMALFSGFFVMFIIGPILDTGSLFLMASEINLKTAAAIYLSGLPLNVAHAVSTLITILLLYKPITEKFNRLKSKYGILSL